MFCEAVENACNRLGYRLAAFVIMPEHVHLLVYPDSISTNIDQLLFAIKRPFSYRFKQYLIETNSSLLNRLTSHGPSGKGKFRFWQQGPGYDRNLTSEKAVIQAIDYIHANPVHRGLVGRARDWKWSSARWHELEQRSVDPELPKIHGVPWHLFRLDRP